MAQISFAKVGSRAPGSCLGSQQEDGVGLESALGPGALRCRPSRPGWTALPLGTTLCGSPVPAARGSAAAWLCSPVTPRPPPRVPWSSGAMPAPSSGSCPPSCSVRCLQVCPSSRKPPWVRSSLLTVTVPESHPLEGVWPRSPPISAGRWSDGECGVGATSCGPGRVEGQGLVFTEPVASAA